MDTHNFRIDRIGYTSLLSACANMKALRLGKELHARLIKDGIHLDCTLLNTLIHMYARCGTLENAQSVFDIMDPQKMDVITWTSIISAYGQSGLVKQMEELFERMKCTQTRPNVFTWTAVIAAYGQSGYVEKIKVAYKEMQRGGVKPGL